MSLTSRSRWTAGLLILVVIPLTLYGCRGESDTETSGPMGPDISQAVDDPTQSGVLPSQPDADPVVGAIGIYADASASSCSILDEAGEKTAVVVHTGSGCKTGGEFSAPFPSCMRDATHLADVVLHGVWIGSTQEGLANGYGNYLSGVTPIVIIYYDTPGKTLPCCAWEVLPYPGRDTPMYATCGNPIEDGELPGRYAVVNENASCPCALEDSALPDRWRRIRGLAN